jgi:hypothetical protein
MTWATAPAAGWRGPILRHFPPDIAKVVHLTVVADPDRLFSDAALLGELRNRGYDPVLVEDPVALRFVYETSYRPAWRRGEGRSLVVLWAGDGSAKQALPYDVFDGARQSKRLLNFGLADLLPGLVSGVVRGVQGEELDRLFDAVAKHSPGELGANATADFVLRHVYGVAPELIRTPVDLFVMLLRRHHQGVRLPPVIEERLLSLLRQETALSSWPLERLVTDRSAFLTFLQERWGRFVVAHLPTAESVADRPSFDAPPAIPGPIAIPFDHPDLRVYVDTLFLEGLLVPTRAVAQRQVRGSWLAVGVAADAEEDQVAKLRALTESTAREVPDVSAGHRDWLAFAMRWAEWGALRWTLTAAATAPLSAGIEHLHELVERRFGEWAMSHFSALQALSYWPRAVMVHQVPRQLAHAWVPESGPRRRALVVVDGLALSQWVVLRESLPAGLQGAIDQAAAFAWVPTLTAVSRQAIFAGDAPLFFAGNLLGNSREETLWRRFWDDKGRGGAAVEYIRQKRDEADADFLPRVRQVADGPRVTVLGVVLGTVDRMIHGAAIGSYGLHCQVRDWGRAGVFGELVTMLLEQGFEVTVTSDHGNVEAVGRGSPNEGVVADERGERVRVFPDDVARATVASRFPAAVCWPGHGLPGTYRALIAPGLQAFVAEGARVVTHGGLSLEEVVVPLITFRKAEG